LNAGSAVAAVETTFAEADFFFATQAFLLRFCCSYFQALTQHLLPCAHKRGGLVQEKLMRLLNSHVLKNSLAQAPIATHS
jgi:hypothetical protein